MGGAGERGGETAAAAFNGTHGQPNHRHHRCRRPLLQVWDVAVAPAWQRGGLGRALVERLTASLVEDGIPTITLYAGG